jgi:hypothetical protein
MYKWVLGSSDGYSMFDLMCLSTFSQEYGFVSELIKTCCLISWIKVLLEKLIGRPAGQEMCSLLCEPKGSLPCSEEPTTGPYSEPVYEKTVS